MRRAPWLAIAAALSVAVVVGVVYANSSTRLPVTSPSPQPALGSAAMPTTATAAVTINGREFRIAPGPTTAVWRSFMPGSPPTGAIASVRVVTADGGPFPHDITVDRLRIDGPTVWDVAPSEVRRAPEAGTLPSQIEVVARDGPNWDPGAHVGLVIRLRSGGAAYYLHITGLTVGSPS